MKCTSLVDFFTFVVKDASLDVKAVDWRSVVQDYLEMDVALFEDNGHRLRGYSKCLEFGGISVGYEAFGVLDASHVCLSMSGQGCRYFEKFGSNFLKLFGKVHRSPNSRATRLDIAYDFTDGLRFSRFIDVFERDGCQVRSHVRNESVILDRINGVEAGGTFYVGNYHHSEQFLRIYNKAHQMYSPVDLNYDKSWVRVEHVMKRNYANAAIEAILNSGLDDFGEVCAEILNGFMTIVDESDFNISRCKVVQWWSEALETLIAVKLWEPGQIVHTVTKKMQYLRDFLAPTFAMICSALGSDYNFNYFINRLVRDGTYRMSERQRSLAQSYRMSSSGLPI
ncbi:Cro/Cl family transcriptional regulator [Clostridia bacterium]|nr:Cro/Cl family transcriptional regulator [Clostridia bacterium]